MGNLDDSVACAHLSSELLILANNSSVSREISSRKSGRQTNKMLRVVYGETLKIWHTSNIVRQDCGGS
jgi:hypothetical protein